MVASQRKTSSATSNGGPPPGTTPNAALAGAALAFSRPVPPQRQLATTAPTGAALNGAVWARQRAEESMSNDGLSRQSTGQGIRRTSRQDLSRQSTGQELRQNALQRVSRQSTGQGVRQYSQQGRSISTYTGSTHESAQGTAEPFRPWASANGASKLQQASSPLAASGSLHSSARSAVASSNGAPATRPKPRRLSQNSRVTSVERSDARTDDSSIAPTTSLVGMFERKTVVDDTTPRKRSRPSSQLTVDIHQAQADRVRSPTLDGSVTSKDESYFSAPEDKVLSPVTIRKQRSNILTSIQPPTPSPSNSQFARPSSPVRPLKTAPIDINASSSRSPTMPPMSRTSSAHSQQSITATYHQLYQRRPTALTTGDDLANAIVASSLASRTSSPRKYDSSLTLPPPRRGHGTASRTPSPAKKGMRHTLREAESTSSDSEDELHPFGKHKRKRHLRKHPNKHHEGDRKRWREAVTERERKRYAGVWAANRGLYCSLTPAEVATLGSGVDLSVARAGLQDQVCSIVVKDLWSRSRLPEHELEIVWDLVASSPSTNRLGKEEFVVGMWLIDQRLKGRKLPPKVSQTVWASVRGIEGIKVKKFLG